MSDFSRPAKEFLGTDLVQQHIELAALELARSLSQSFRESAVGLLSYGTTFLFDSPLEIIFLIWWWSVTDYGLSRIGDILGLRPQTEVTAGDKRYRVDFLVEPVDAHIAAHPLWIPIVVELDGHAFHERTKEQVTLRDSRDRALQALGWRVFHFSFTEFTANPIDCVAEVALYARKQWNDVSMKLYADGHRIGQ